MRARVLDRSSWFSTALCSRNAPTEIEEKGERERKRERENGRPQYATDDYALVLASPCVLYGLEKSTTIRIASTRSMLMETKGGKGINRRTNERTNERTSERASEGTNKHTKERTDRRTDGLTGNSHGFYGSARKDIPKAFSVEPGPRSSSRQPFGLLLHPLMADTPGPGNRGTWRGPRGKAEGFGYNRAH